MDLSKIGKCELCVLAKAGAGSDDRDRGEGQGHGDVG